LPRLIGSYNDEKVTAAIGRFGPYIKYGSLFASIPKDKDLFAIDIAEAIEIILAKQKAEAEKLMRSFKEDKDLEILKGRWGPYISYKKDNYKFPKEADAVAMPYAEIMKIIESSAPPAKSKKAAATKSAPKAKAKAKAKAKTKKK
jgi:DNA topoisomerase-1